jgi:hypothetical protein
MVWMVSKEMEMAAAVLRAEQGVLVLSLVVLPVGLVEMEGQEEVEHRPVLVVETTHLTA